MPAKAPEDRPPPPLAALGGWPAADWFSDSVLSDEEVVGFTLPKLPGVPKQTFRLAERSAANGGKAAHAARRPSPAARLGQILDQVGVTRAAAFGRTRLLYDPPPTLFFAEFPLARAKLRAANKLRQALIQDGFRGCVLQIGRTHLIAMFWPASETAITGFVDAAAPPHPMHIQFDKAEDERAKLAASPGPDGKRQAAPARPACRKSAAGQPLGPRERNRLQAENQALLRQIADLRAQIDRMQKSRSTLGAMEQLGLDDARLKSMLRLLHPDKHGNSEAATEAAKWINGLRDMLKGGRAD